MAKLKGTTFDSLSRQIAVGRSLTIGNNTTAERVTDDLIEVRLHGHHIASLSRDGSVYLCDAGYQTVTTKERLNQFAPAGVKIFQEAFSWYFKESGDWSKENRFDWTGSQTFSSWGYMIDPRTGDRINANRVRINQEDGAR